MQLLFCSSVPYYIDDLNSNPSLRPLPNEAEISLLDRALLTVDHFPETAMKLCDLYLTDVLGKDVDLVLDPRVRSPQSKKISTPVSKDKLKRQDYALTQKLYKRNQSKALEEPGSSFLLQSTVTLLMLRIFSCK